MQPVQRHALVDHHPLRASVPSPSPLPVIFTPAVRIPVQRLSSRIGRALRRDRYGLRRRLRDLQRAARAGKASGRQLSRLVEDVAGSIERRAQRRQTLPRPRFPEELPVAAQRRTIADAIRGRATVIVCGQTGSGKSTQLPKICLELGLGVDGMIGHTQPRRIAARSIATRIAAELGSPLGQHVGFKVRFADTVGDRTFIKVMTDGILVAELGHDRFLEQYDAIIIDEAHERSLNIDVLLGAIRRLQPRRPDLKLIIASATLDAERFSEHFADRSGPAPIVSVSGRTYPVEVRHQPPDTLEDGGELDAVRRAVLDAVDEVTGHGRGDILIFMPTERDINETAKALRRHAIPGDDARRRTEILPLYARLSVASQNRVFQPARHRRIVIATNVAESSLTVPGIRYVIDEGTARISRYAARSKLQRLPIEPISQASAEQRKGRCGRVGPGLCIRLFSAEDLAARDAHTQPEILRTNLAAVILRMDAARLGRVEDFPFLDPPRPAMVRDGYDTLREIGALDERGQLTGIGRRLADLPVDPRIGRMILAAHEEDCLNEVLMIASALECEDPRLRPPDHAADADAAHERFRHEDSDFLAFLAIWDFCQDLKHKLSRSRFRVACERHYLSHQRIREWTDLHRQLLDLVGQAGLPVRPRRDDADAIHRALLAGLLSNIALKTDRFEYTGAGGKKLRLWPGSSQFDRRPQWIVAAEQLETTQRYARTVARVQPAAIEPLAAHLVQRSYDDPRWDRRSGHVVAFEKVSLYGLPIVPRRRVHYGGVDPPGARALFIHHALVLGELDTPIDVLDHNRRVIAEVEALEARTRRRDLLADEGARFAFYEGRLPPDVCNVPSLRRWLKSMRRRRANVLHMTRADVLAADPGDHLDGAFPDRLACGDAELPLTYRYAPGAPEDGITLTVPLPCMRRLDPIRLSWLVPGRVREKVIELIRSLPKPLRQHFVPAPDFADALLREGLATDTDIEAAVAARLQATGGVPVRRADFQLEKLPPHLRLRYCIVDADGRAIAAGRELGDLMSQLARARRGPVDGVIDRRWHRDGLRRWDCGDLPADVTIVVAGVAMKMVPTLVDTGETVALRLLDDADAAARAHHAALRRLVVIEIGAAIRHQIDLLADFERWALWHAPLGTAARLKQDLVDLVADRAMKGDPAAVRGPAAFEALANVAWNGIAAGLAEVAPRVAAVLEHMHRLDLVLTEMTALPWQEAVEDVREQVAGLLGPRFLVDTPWEWLAQVPRYLTAAERRLRKVARDRDLRRDQGLALEVSAYAAAHQVLAARCRDAGRHVPEVARLGWMIEEYRVSRFAQELGTAIPVSPKRLDDLLGRCRRLTG